MSSPVKSDRSLVESVKLAVRSNGYIDQKKDAALIAATLAIARQMDQVIELGDLGAMTPSEVQKALYMLPHLQANLRELLATPSAREQADNAAAKRRSSARKAGGESKLTELRSARTAKGTSAA